MPLIWILFKGEKDMSDITIRTASPEDAAEILGIYKYYIENTSITFEWEVPSLEEFRSRIENTLQKYPYIVAVQNEKIIGYAYVSPFKTRAAYDWAVETSIYVQKDGKRHGTGRLLLENLESILKKMNILNVNACIAYPETEDEYLTKDSVRFHEKMGYSMVGEFHKCGYKFNRWYNMVWMEKMLGDHVSNQPKVLKFGQIV